MVEHSSHKSSDRSRSRNRFFHSKLYLTYLYPATFFAGSILLVIVAKLCHADLKAALAGAMSVVILTITKTRKEQFGLLLSMACLVLMIMANLWNWVDHYFVALYSGSMITESTMFRKGLGEGLIMVVVVWLYLKLLKNLNMHVTSEWFVRKSQLKFLKLLFFFQLFLVFFWVAGFGIDTSRSAGHYDQQEATLTAGLIALVAALVPALIYLYLNTGSRAKHRHNRHRHRHQHHRQEKLPA